MAFRDTFANEAAGNNRGISFGRAVPDVAFAASYGRRVYSLHARYDSRHKGRQ